MQDNEVIMLIKEPTRNIIIMELWSKQNVGNFCFVSPESLSWVLVLLSCVCFNRVEQHMDLD